MNYNSYLLSLLLLMSPMLKAKSDDSHAACIKELSPLVAQMIKSFPAVVGAVIRSELQHESMAEERGVVMDQESRTMVLFEKEVRQGTVVADMARAICERADFTKEELQALKGVAQSSALRKALSPKVLEDTIEVGMRESLERLGELVFEAKWAAFNHAKEQGTAKQES
ncbi:hypothetical protein HOM50_02500 [bacterium]|nr:hypothetical protein [bacterium]MBT5015253.1 hypothetical protein [bacterium]